MDFSHVGRALASRNYRLFLFGQAISLIGTWMQQVAMSWLLYRLTGSAFLLGLIGFASQLPSLFLSPLAGVAADRWNRHRALLFTQSLAMLQAVLVLVVTQTTHNVVWPLIGLGIFLGVINAFDMPLRQAFLSHMVGSREHLSNAIALNSSIVNGARLVGPSLAGLIIARWGEGACFLLNALSYVAVLLALAAMRDLPLRQERPAGRFHEHLREGLAYAIGFPPLRTLLLMVSVISLMSMPLSVLMPVFAKVVLAGDANTQGFLTGGMGAGALCGALYMASRATVLGLGRVMAYAASLFGAGLMAFSLCQRLAFALPVLAIVGFAMMVHLSACNTLIQTIVDEDKRGRVMSFYTMAFLGSAPLGSLLGGTLAARWGAPLTVRLAGSVCLVAAALFALQLPQLRRHIRPIYQRIGVLPQPIAPSAITPAGS